MLFLLKISCKEQLLSEMDGLEKRKQSESQNFSISNLFDKFIIKCKRGNCRATVFSKKKQVNKQTSKQEKLSKQTNKQQQPSKNKQKRKHWTNKKHFFFFTAFDKLKYFFLVNVCSLLIYSLPTVHREGVPCNQTTIALQLQTTDRSL